MRLIMKNPCTDNLCVNLETILMEKIYHPRF